MWISKRNLINMIEAEVKTQVNTAMARTTVMQKIDDTETVFMLPGNYRLHLKQAVHLILLHLGLRIKVIPESAEVIMLTKEEDHADRS